MQGFEQDILVIVGSAVGACVFLVLYYFRIVLKKHTLLVKELQKAIWGIPRPGIFMHAVKMSGSFQERLVMAYVDPGVMRGSTVTIRMRPRGNKFPPAPAIAKDLSGLKDVAWAGGWVQVKVVTENNAPLFQHMVHEVLNKLFQACQKVETMQGKGS